MNALYEHLVAKVATALRSGVAVIVDATAAFEPFIEELTGAVAWDSDNPGTTRLTIQGSPAQFARFTGSWFGLKGAIEQAMAADRAPDPPLLVYVPTRLPVDQQNVLTEALMAGTALHWSLDREARQCLRDRLTDGVIDEVLAGGTATYDDVVLYLDQGSRTASKLKLVFPGRSDTDILLRWLVDTALDGAIDGKGATTELRRLIASRLGLELDTGLGLDPMRALVARYVLLAEFLADLGSAPPSALTLLPRPTVEAHVAEALALCVAFRAGHSEAYVVCADRVESELRLAQAAIDPSTLGRIDTFRFEERALLDWCGKLLVGKRYSDATAVVVARASSFWVRRDDDRFAQWELCRRVAELGARVVSTASELLPSSAAPSEWVRRYSAPDGWHEMDSAQRALETFRAQVSDESEAERAAAIVLRSHEALLQKMAERFQASLESAGWSVSGVLPQTRIHAELVAPRAAPVAYFWVDAMRYEMGAELARLLDGALELQLRPAVGALPSITPVGMAALLPGASSHFAVVERGGKLTALVDGSAVGTAKERELHVKSRVPESADLRLGELLQLKPSELKSRVQGRALVVVRSQEIDELGEKGNDWLARRAMSEVLGDLALAVRRLAKAGIEHFVVTADHGHLFGLRKGDDMKTDAPGGQAVETHRRCWIGRGGATPTGTVRVSGAQLGYASDLEFVFPTGLGVLKSGGDLSFHHGSTSLQELVVPVLSFRFPPPAVVAGGFDVHLIDVPTAVTNRFFSVHVDVQPRGLFSGESVRLRLVLMAEQSQVGHAAMTDVPDFDAKTHVVVLRPGARAQVAMRLTHEDVTSVRVVALDPETGAVLAESNLLANQLSR